jgi:hypothetical protein
MDMRHRLTEVTIQNRQNEGRYFKNHRRSLSEEDMKTLLRIIAMVVLTFLMLSLTKCDSRKSNTDKSKIEVNFDLKNEQKQVRNDLEALRKDIDRELEKVHRKLEQASGETKARLERANRELLNEKVKVNRALEDVNKAGEKTWADAKLAARNTAYDVRDSFRRIGNELSNVFSADNEKH